MKTLISLILLLMATACGRTVAAESEPDWAQRFDVLKRKAILDFSSPEIGKEVTVIRRVGVEWRGRLNEIGLDSVTVGGYKFPASSLTIETSEMFFPEAYATRRAMELLREEMDAYLAENASEQQRFEMRLDLDRKAVEIQRLHRIEWLRVDENPNQHEKARLEEQARIAAAEKLLMDTNGLRIGMAFPAHSDPNAVNQQWFQMEQFLSDCEKTDQQEESPLVERSRLQLEESKRLDFKGFRLGMTYDQIEDLVLSSHWEYENIDQKIHRYSFVFLTTKPSAPVDFRIIGPKATDGNMTYYDWSRAFGQYYEGQLFTIKVFSPVWTAEHIDTTLKNWLRVAYKELVGLYGIPAKTIHAIDEVDKSSFMVMYNVFLYKWIVDEQQIALAINVDTSGSKYSASIHLTDLVLQRKHETENGNQTDYHEKPLPK